MSATWWATPGQALPTAPSDLACPAGHILQTLTNTTPAGRNLSNWINAVGTQSFVVSTGGVSTTLTIGIGLAAGRSYFSNSGGPATALLPAYWAANLGIDTEIRIPPASALNTPLANITYQLSSGVSAFRVHYGDMNSTTNAWRDGVVSTNATAGVTVSVDAVTSITVDNSTPSTAATATANTGAACPASGTAANRCLAQFTWQGSSVNTLTNAASTYIAAPMGTTNTADSQFLIVRNLSWCVPPPAVNLAKVTSTGSGTFAFSTSNLSSASISLTTVSPNNTVTAPSATATAATPVSITESLPAGYTVSNVVCLDANSAGTGNSPGNLASWPAGSATFSLAGSVVKTGAQVTCTVTNRRIAANLGVSKTNGAGTVPAGGTTAYTITFSNSGPDAAPNAVVSDTPGAGLICNTATCAASGGASCPAPYTPGPAPAASLLAGLSIPTFPAASSLTFTVNCGISATGT